MFLKRLVMKGFKSFADPTALDFEPGVTAVVGPNGSGKSNVVDAVTWVLGAQSTRALRSAKMEDVIFAGTASRPPLGRAEVALTLDNASGRLPIDGAEVTISRTLFRSGESEYAINGTACRLLDIQELLGDSGVGRQQHMIIGQGQLDAVLNSHPEDRRAVIEEAAGVLKHRRRKERAERRLEATQENLERLGDLVREVRRQMRPLERQAVAARSYAAVEAELRVVQRHLFAARLTEQLDRRRELERTLHSGGVRERELRHELVGLDARAAAAAGELSSRRSEDLAEERGAAAALVERARGLSQVIAERVRGVEAALRAAADANVVATLEADAAQLSAALATVDREDAPLRASRRELEVAQAALAEAEAQFASTWGDPAAARGPLEDAAAALARAASEVTTGLEALARGETRLGEVRARLERAVGGGAAAVVGALDQLRAEVAALEADHAIAATHVSAARVAVQRLEEIVGAMAGDAADAEERAQWATEARATVDAHREQVAARAAELARLEAEISERRRLLRARRDEVEARLAGHSGERREAAQRRERLEADRRDLRRLAQVVEATSTAAAQAHRTLDAAYRAQLESSRAGAEELESLRRRRAVVEGELSSVTEAARRDEIELAELSVKIETLEATIQRELGLAPAAIFPAPIPDLAEGTDAESRLAELEAQIGALGPINPLALEELTTLEARYAELDAQVSDVRHARRELLEVLRALEQEIMATFSAAVADVNEHFSALIAKLFPGGQGRLILTAPEDPLNTGVEIEVRPMGRNVRRISLLSGGERSMAALAFLFAVFRSRPSPFYLMDEVEAALDDVNLQRFLSLVDEFRDEAQLLIVTHQKRTMESADVLYGVTIAPGGSSKVVSQRVPREAAVAS